MCVVPLAWTALYRSVVWLYAGFHLGGTEHSTGAVRFVFMYGVCEYSVSSCSKLLLHENETKHPIPQPPPNAAFSIALMPLQTVKFQSRWHTIPQTSDRATPVVVLTSDLSVGVYCTMFKAVSRSLYLTRQNGVPMTGGKHSLQPNGGQGGNI